MPSRLDDQVVVVGGGDAGVGAAVTRALLHAGARVVVPVATDDRAERLYLEADPDTVPRLRTAIGPPDDPATLSRIAAVARREFAGIDHLVAVFPGPAGESLGALDGEGAHAALRAHTLAPGLFALGLLRHLAGPARTRRVVLVTAVSAGPRPDGMALGRSFASGLVELLRSEARPGLEFHTLRAAASTPPDDIGRAVVELLARGAPAAEVEVERPADRPR